MSGPIPPASLDAAVIGGGPAGAAAALLLARAGWRTALIERGGRGRNKTCGGCLSPRAIRILRERNIIDDAIIRSWTATTELCVRTSTAAFFRAPIVDHRGDGGRAVPRATLDQLLIDRAAAAGVHVLQPASARVLRLGRDGAELAVRCENVNRAIRARLVVGADGLRSAVARAAGLSDARRLGAKFGFAFDRPAEAFPLLSDGVIAMHVVAGGYIGMARTAADRVHVGALVGPNADAARDPVAFCRRAAAAFSDLRSMSRLTRRDMLNFIATGPMACPTSAAARGGVALVGDAAGYVEPFTGEGIAWALESAVMLADVAGSASRAEWSEDLARAYNRRWQECIGRMHRRCRAMAYALERPGLTAGICRLSGWMPALSARVVRSVVAA